MTKRAKPPSKKAKAKSKRKLSSSRAHKGRRAIKERPARSFPAWLAQEPADPLDTMIDASARALALPLDPAWKPAVKTNLDVTLRMAAGFADFPLPDDAEPAPVFSA
jgi:hypothetical protein